VGGRPSDPSAGLDAKKKSLRAAEQDPAARAAYREQIEGEPSTRFVVIDECGSNLDLTPRYGRAPRGERAVDAAPRNTPVNTTLIAAMTTDGMGAALLLDGATDTPAFLAYCEHVLVPSLSPGQIVVLDNLSAHKDHRVRDLIAAVGCDLWYLPSYSPDLSPIELAFSKLKGSVRRTKARTRQALDDAIAAALGTITAADAAGFFRHCGYGHAAQ
jgi:transposase